jgi:glc operon protein GlcG
MNCVLDHLEAMKIVRAIEAELTRSRQAAVIAVSDSYGELIALLRVGDVPLSSIRIAMNKAWTAARERQATADIGKASRDPRSGFDISFYGDARYVGWGGGIPVRRGGKVIGAVAVSGLPEELDDAALAELGAAALAEGT